MYHAERCDIERPASPEQACRIPLDFGLKGPKSNRMERIADQRNPKKAAMCRMCQKSLRRGATAPGLERAGCDTKRTGDHERERQKEPAPKGNIVQQQVPSQFAHTTLTSYPDKIVGVTLVDESPGVAGIYLRDKNGGMWPARTVSRFPTEDYETVCDSWLARPGMNEDKRTA